MRIRALTIALAVIVSLAACTAEPGPVTPSNTRTASPGALVSIGIAEPQHLIPQNTTDVNGGQVLMALFTPLVTFDPANRPVPAQAESVTSADSKVWTIRLKHGYTFHNGEAVTADSYLRAWNFGAYGPNAQRANAFFAKIDGYAALNPAKNQPATKSLTGLREIDAYTFQVTLTAPYSEFPSLLGYTAFLPLPAAAFDPTGQIRFGFEDTIIGDGPFQMSDRWEHDQSIRLSRYDAYPGRRPQIGQVQFKIYQDPTVAYADVQANTLDVLGSVPTVDLPHAAKDFGDRYQHSPSSSLQFIAFPTYDENFTDVDVRRAISRAIDRDEIVRTLFASSQTSARSFVSPVVPGYRENSCGDACRYDPAAAKKLYDQTGGPTRLQIAYNADGAHKDWVDAVCAQLTRNLGVRCVSQSEPRFADLLNKVQTRTLTTGTMFRLGWVMDYPSMEDYLTPLYSTHGSSNYYGYHNAQFDELIARGAQQPAAADSIKLYQQAEDILARDLPVIPLRFGQNNFVYSTNVQHVTVDLYGYVDLADITTLAS